MRARVRACKCHACLIDASALCILCVMAALLHMVMPVVLTLHHLLCVVVAWPSARGVPPKWSSWYYQWVLYLAHCRQARDSWHRLAAGVPPGHHREAVRDRFRLGTHTRCPSRFALSRFALSHFALSRLASRVLSLRPSSSPHWTIGELLLGSSTQGSHTHALTTCTHTHTYTRVIGTYTSRRRPAAATAALCSCAAHRCALAFVPCRTWRRALKCV